MGRTWWPALAFTVGLALLAASLGAPSRVQATNLLANGSFESWTGPSPSAWSVVGGSVTAEEVNIVAGRAVRASGATTTVSQTVPVDPGATYSATVHASGTPGGQATIILQFLTDDFLEVGGAPPLSTANLVPTYVVITGTSLAPETAAYVVFSVRLTPFPGQPLEAFADEAALVMTIPAQPASTPTATATSPSTSTASPTSPSTATSQVTAGATNTAVPTPTSTVQPTSTAVPTTTEAATATVHPTPSPTSHNGSTPTRTPTSTRTPTPIPTATSTRIPTAPKATTPAKTSTSTPTAKPSGTSTTRPPDSGGMLQNGGFELETDGRPEAWNKYGGSMGLTTDAYEGARAATLESDTASTKWLYQAVPTDAGHRYAASAVSRIADGQGDVFLRLSWYASDDGSGTTIEQADSPPSSSTSWTRLETTQDAPSTAHSVRVRLMLRPAGTVTVFFDSAMLADLGPAPPDPIPAGPGPDDPVDPASGDSSGAPPVSPTRPDSPASPSGLSLRLSEVLSDPEETGRDSPYEWVELVNVGSDPVDLNGWSLSDARGTDTLPALHIPPGGYVVVAGRSVRAIPGVAMARVADGEVGAGLNNSGDVVTLVAPDGTVNDALSFGDDDSVFEPPPPAPPAGRTLGIRLPGADPSSDNWALTERPSPGGPNVFPSPAPQAAERTRDERGRAADPGIVARDGKKSAGALPWVTLGLASGAGIMGLGLAGRRAWPDIRRRMKRGG